LQANNLFPYACLDSSFILSGKHFSSFLLAWIPLFASQASILSLFCLPGFPFRFTGKHFLAFPLAWTLLFPIRQAFPRFSACLDSSFSSQASISPLFRLPGFHFWLSGSRLYLE
jgi:hypothetical protein